MTKMSVVLDNILKDIFICFPEGKKLKKLAKLLTYIKKK